MSNFKPATKPATFYVLSNFKPATKAGSIKSPLQYSIVSLFYYNTNFKINQAVKAVKFSRANLKRFKL